MARTTAARKAPAVSDAEWQARVDLAAAYQLTDLYGWSDLSSTHISVRVPGEDAFLINPYGMMFGEITASRLLKVDHKGRLLVPSDYPFNPAGFIIHGAIHRARADVHCVMHTHTRAGIAVAMQADGLLPVSQKALILMGFLAYHDFEGVVLETGEQDRLIADLGDGKIMILRNHGLMSVGATVAEAFVWMHRLEAACRYQVDGMAGGARLCVPPEEVRRKTIEQGLRVLGPQGHARTGFEWPSIVRELERARGTSYRT
ncbi:MAG: class II aldolase/adducin family protein [Alphaproteobacteria bacterium]|nr:class II aldolase/adducin family protein [Alphaproteobacteria bacterium]